MNRLERGGEAFLSKAMLGSKFALRLCIVNFRTSLEDIEALPEIVIRLGRQVDEELRTGVSESGSHFLYSQSPAGRLRVYSCSFQNHHPPLPPLPDCFSKKVYLPREDLVCFAQTFPRRIFISRNRRNPCRSI